LGLLPALSASVRLLNAPDWLHPALRYPQWDYIFGFVWIIVMLVDLPVSLVAYALAWKFGVLAAVWIFVAGTGWWYFLSGIIERVVESFRHRNEISTLNLS
jgi:hypothetical protein